MSVASNAEQFREIVRLAENRERIRIGAALPAARAALARRWKVAAGTLENIRRGRFKDIGHSICQRIGNGILADLNHEIMRLDHERSLLLQCGFGADSREVNEVENVMAKVRTAYEAMVK